MCASRTRAGDTYDDVQTTNKPKTNNVANKQTITNNSKQLAETKMQELRRYDKYGGPSYLRRLNRRRPVNKQ